MPLCERKSIISALIDIVIISLEEKEYNKIGHFKTFTCLVVPVITNYPHKKNVYSRFLFFYVLSCNFFRHINFCEFGAILKKHNGTVTIIRPC